MTGTCKYCGYSGTNEMIMEHAGLCTVMNFDYSPEDTELKLGEMKMLMHSKYLIPLEDKKEPWYIVMTKNKKSDRVIYVKNYGVQKFATYIDDSIIEQTENLCDALMFCRKEDASKVASSCTFKCNCGCIDKVGKLIKVTKSGRTKDGVTYGESASWSIPGAKEIYFNTVYDYVEEDFEYEADYSNLFDD